MMPKRLTKPNLVVDAKARVHRGLSAHRQGPGTADKRLGGRRSQRYAAGWAALSAIPTWIWRQSVAALVFLLFVGGASLRPVAAEFSESVPREVRDVTVDQKLGESLPRSLRLVDSLGRATRSGHYLDGQRPLILTLNYSSCPVLCSVQLDALVRSLDQLDLRLGRDFQILTVSIDPQETTAQVRQTRQRYLEELTNQAGAESAWHFCTARDSTIKQLADAVGFRYRYDRQTGEYYHPAMLAFISPEGVISRYSLDVAFPPDQLKLALLEAAEGKIGSPVDQLLLWCFSYDSDRGSYVLASWWLMRLAAATTVAILLATLIPYWLGRRRSAAAGRAARAAPADGALSAATSQPLASGR